MHIGTWWLYALTVFVVAGTPGPNMLHIMTRSIQVGTRRSVFAMMGCLSAVLLCLFASAFGLGAMLKAEPRLFDILRYGGVAYLIWLGIKAWRSPVTAPDGAASVRPVQSAGSLYRGGLLIGLSNPKLIVFAAALFPQFVDARMPFAPQLGLMVATFAAIECFWYTAYALGGRSLARWLEPVNRQRLFNRVTGGLFIGFGAALLGARV
ncbi:MAG: LysE family translocator [bacterium]|nr:LysE family translocator [bacterium]